MRRRGFSVGLDLGQSHGFTAMSVVELAELVGECDPVIPDGRVPWSLTADEKRL
jgi:hypothetical protein